MGYSPTFTAGFTATNSNNPIEVARIDDMLHALTAEFDRPSLGFGPGAPGGI